MTLYLNNKKGLFHATCEYQNSVYIVKKGSKIKATFADYIKGGKTSKRYRDNAEYVNSEGILLQDCIFKSPSMEKCRWKKIKRYYIGGRLWI